MTESLTMILSALAGGAAAMAEKTGGAAVKDAYDGLKNLIKKKFNSDPAGEMALEKHEEKPESSWKGVLQEALEEKNAAGDDDIRAAAETLLGKLREEPETAKILIRIENSQGAIGQVNGNVTQTYYQNGSK